MNAFGEIKYKEFADRCLVSLACGDYYRAGEDEAGPDKALPTTGRWKVHDYYAHSHAAMHILKTRLDNAAFRTSLSFKRSPSGPLLTVINDVG